MHQAGDGYDKHTLLGLQIGQIYAVVPLQKGRDNLIGMI